METSVAEALFSLLITILEKMGLITAVDAAAAKGIDSLSRLAEHIKTYSDYDIKKNEPFATTEDP
jgi:hypothetical protein